MKNKIKKTEIEEIIRSILGKDKFLMLNKTLIKKLTPNGACLITYLLDKYEYLIKTKSLNEDEGMYIFRRELTQELGLSKYQQRIIESDLMSKELINVVEVRTNNETFNTYYFNLYNLYEFVTNDSTGLH